MKQRRGIILKFLMAVLACGAGDMVEANSDGTYSHGFAIKRELETRLQKYCNIVTMDAYDERLPTPTIMSAETALVDATNFRVLGYFYGTNLTYDSAAPSFTYTMPNGNKVGAVEYTVSGVQLSNIAVSTSAYVLQNSPGVVAFSTSHLSVDPYNNRPVRGTNFYCQGVGRYVNYMGFEQCIDEFFIKPVGDFYCNARFF